MTGSSSHAVVLWVVTMAYAAHILEEYTLDWKTWATRALKLNVSWSNFYVTNAVVVVLGLCTAAIGWTMPEVSLMFPALALINAVFFHIGPTILQRRFSPGLITATLLFLPIGIWAYVSASADGVLSWWVTLISVLGGALLMLYPIVMIKVKYREQGETVVVSNA